ncbi:MAG: alpha/beta hydrolase [Planctomycetota bacterium]
MSADGEIRVGRRLVLLPGLGADARLFEPQREAFGDRLATPEWPEMEDVSGAWSLDEMGRRLADRLASDGLLDGAPVVIGGVSFGGQVSLEAARVLCERGLAVHAVVLIASSRSHEAVPARFRRQQSMGWWIPAPVVRWLLARPMASLFASMNGLSEADGRLLRRIASDVNVRRLKKQAAACAGWRFEPEAFVAETGVPIRQIHGRLDPVIPLREGDPDRVIEDGRHLIHLANADEVNAYLADVLGD